MAIEADKRSRNVEPAPEAKRAARAAFRQIAAAETKAAKALATIERRRAYVLDGFRSIHAWAKSVGYGPQQTRRLLELGRTLLDEEDLEEKVAKGDMPAETAAQIGRMFRDPKVQFGPQEKAEWKDKAQNQDPDKVRNDAEQTTEDAHQGAPTFLMRFRVTKEARDGFRRVRQLMQLAQIEPLSDGEVFGLLVKDHLARHDPAEKPLPKRGKRRSSKRSRTVPERVKAIVRRRSGGQCELCGTRPARELIHIVPFSKGGSNEADNLADGCTDCHVLYDAGVYRFVRFSREGHPVFEFDHDRLAAYRARDQDGASTVSEPPPPRYGYSSGRRRRRGVAMTTGPPYCTSRSSTRKISVELGGILPLRCGP